MTNAAGLNDKSVVRGMELRLDTAFGGANTSFPPSVQQIVVGGVAYSQPDLQKKIDSVRAPWKDARTAHATLRQFTQQKPALEQEATEFLTMLKGALVAQFGAESETLSHWGFKPQKRRRQLTSDEKALRAAKAAMTRKARGTKGKRQKAEITGPAPTVNIGADGSVTIQSPGQSPKP